jgi:uncharacterized protein YbcI
MFRTEVDQDTDAKRTVMGQPSATRPATPPEPATAPTLEIANVLFAGADVLVVMLEDTMTVQERTLAALGEQERLRAQRLFLTTAAEDQFRTIVEDALGRRTIARVSGFDIDRDVAAEIFTLEPEPTNGTTT